MTLAPEPVLRAALDTVGWACIFIRNQTIQEGAPTKMINDAMEAVHGVPQMLTHWRPDTLGEIRIHLGCFPASQWQEAPDLVAFFEQRLRDYGYEEVLEPLIRAFKDACHPEPQFELGDQVETVGDQHTFRVGFIRDRIWHHKDGMWHFYLDVDGRHISKRYSAADLQKAKVSSDPKP